MPKVNHRKGYQGSSIEEMCERNKGLDGFDPSKKGKGKGKGKPEEQKEPGSDSEDDEEQAKAKANAKKKDKPEGFEVENPNARQRNEEKEGVEMTRKQREELEKQAARRRYEELHKAGKTDEAKADLARLAEVKKRREEAAKKKEEEAKAKEEEEKRLSAKDKEYKEALGGSKKIATQTAPRVKNDVNLYSYVDGAGEKVKAKEDKFVAVEGSIDACREAEDDFM